MYNEGSNFFVVDRNYDVVQVICGLTQMRKLAQPYVESNIVGESFNLLENSWLGDLYITRNVKVDYIIYDENDVIVPTKFIMAVMIERYQSNPRRDRDRKVLYEGWKYRCDPVPYTGKDRRWRARHRNFRFMNEVRQTFGNEEYIRPKRIRGIGFVDGWYDDDYRSDTFIRRSWKKNKKRKQWM